MIRYRRYVTLLGARKTALLIGLFGSCVRVSLLLPIPLISAKIIDQALNQRDAAMLFGSTAGMAGLGVAAAIVAVIVRNHNVKLVKDLIGDFRYRLIGRLHEISSGRDEPGDGKTLHAVLIQDMERFDAFANKFLDIVIPALLLALAVLLACLWLAPLPGLLAVLVILATIIIASRIRRPIGPAVAAYHGALQALSRGCLDSLEQLDLFRLIGHPRTLLNRRYAEISTLTRHGVGLLRASSIAQEGQSLLMFLSGLGILAVGGFGVIAGQLSLGDLLGIYAAFTLMRNLGGQIMANLQPLSEGWPAWLRIDHRLGVIEPRPDARRAPVRALRCIEAAGLVFRYRDRIVLDGVNLRLTAGRVTALIGRNGSGKSTIVRLLLGLEQPISGRLSADGVDYAEIDTESLRHRIGVVPQSPILFNGTVQENILCFRPDLTRGDAEWALALAMRDGLALLPDGLETKLGEHGATLSGGQRQRIALARALVTRPDMLILDEPTNHLDQQGLLGLSLLLRDLPGNPAVLVISHDDSLTKLADEVLLLRDGKLERNAIPSLQAIVT